MKELITSLNWRQILLFLLATLLIVIGLRRFVFLNDTELSSLLIKRGELMELENGPIRLKQIIIWTAACDMLGLFISGLIIFQLTRRVKRYWINLLIILFLGFIAIRLKFIDLGFFKQVLSIGGLFS